MNFGRRTSAERMLLIEITPMIDVIFLLIIFFMTTARFAQDTRAEIDLPREQGDQQEEAEEAGIVINIDSEGTVIVAGETMTMEDLDALVLSEAARTPGRDPEGLKLMIRADRNADTGRMNEIIKRLQRLGVGAARVATEVPN